MRLTKSLPISNDVKPAYAFLPSSLTTLVFILGWLPLLCPTNGQFYGRAWTFSKPNGQSYLGFQPVLVDGGNQHYVLQFKTSLPSGLLFHHHIVNIQKSGLPSLQKYKLFVELKDGTLRAGFIFNEFEDHITMGQVLHDDQWHSVELYVDTGQEEMSLTLDGNKETETLKAYGWGQAKDLLVWSHLTTWFTVGAIEIRDPQDAKNEFLPYAGCIQDLEYAVDGMLIPAPFNTSMGVLSGCLDKCMEGDRVCNTGKCVNKYTHILCDCYGTDYEGDRCQLADPTVMTFRGYEWVRYHLYHNNQTSRLLMDNALISMEFKTDRNSGVLLYAVGGTPFHSHVTISVYSGEIHASISFEKDDVTFSGGIGLDDGRGRWHNLTIIHQKEIIQIFLDGKATKQQITSGKHFLSLDPYVYVGGGDNFVQTKSLPVTRNFVGCLRNVYINGISVLHQLSTGSHWAQYNGGLKPQFGCHQVDQVPISFPRFSSMLIWSEGERGQNLDVDFKIRTYSATAIVLYVEIITRKDSGSGYDFGSVELWLQDKMAVLQFIPSSRDKTTMQNVTLPVFVSDGLEHSIQVSLLNSKVKLRVDALSAESKRFHKVLEHRGKVVLGYSLRQVKEHYGFVGCMHSVQIQGQILDPITLVDSSGSVGLILDGCQLVDHCASNNVCEHNAECVSDWHTVHCLCQHNYYQGKACHFPKYAVSCEEYHRMGYRTSGIYMIDLDGPGDLDPVYVTCEMDKYYEGVTVVEHNFLPATTVRSPQMADVQYYLAYRGMTRQLLVTLTRNSGKCEQYLKYECNRSPLELSKKTWFKSVKGEIIDYIGSHQSGFCRCPEEGACGGKHCYCDHGKEKSSDSGYNSQRRHLPIMEMTFIQNDAGYGNMTLGPLKCRGSELQPSAQSITLTRSNTFVKLAKWQSGDIRVHFKTHSSQSLLLYHSNLKQEGEKGVHSSRNDNWMAVTIVSSYEAEFTFHYDDVFIKKSLYSSKRLDKGDWHGIAIEYDNFNIRLSLDSTQLLVDLDVAHLPNHFDGYLYVGGLPDSISEKMKTTGFTGCLYGLVYNGKSVNLPQVIDESMGGLSQGCKSSCWPNPCKNGGICEENWGDYTCVCHDPWAHIGTHCETDLNLDAVTLSGEPSSYLFFDISDAKKVLDGSLVLSFRTFLNEAFLIYIHDHMGNFLQLTLSDPHTITVRYNNFNEIIKGFVSTDEPLNDGEWKQVVAEDYFNFTRLMVMGHSKVIEARRGRLKVYSQDPFVNSLERQDTFIGRPFNQPPPFIHAYIGSVKDGATSISPLHGCVRGVRAGDHAFALQKAARLLANGTKVSASCVKGCVADQCHNNGQCEEQWKDGQFKCNCNENGFSGARCDIEPSVTVSGDTVVHHSFSLPSSEQYSLSESLSFRFKADIQPHRLKPMVMVYVTSSQYKDYVLASLDASGNILLETNQGIGVYRISIRGQFANGKPHDFIYVREGKNMYLKVIPIDLFGNFIVDGTKEADRNYPDYPLNIIDNIYIGGLIDKDNQFTTMTNFSGCISNTAYTPKANSPITLHSLRDLYSNVPGVTVIGKATHSCSTSHVEKPTTMAPPRKHSTPNSFMFTTMPAWENNDLRMVTLSAVPMQRTPPNNTPKPFSTTVSNSNSTYPAAVLPNRELDDDITIIIIVVAIATVLIVSLCCVLICVRAKTRSRDYVIKKETDSEPDMELVQPLNHINGNGSPNGSPPFISHTLPKTGQHTDFDKSPRTVNNDHLAKLDEFSMITAILGPRAPKADTLPPDRSRQRYNKGNYPLTEDEMDFMNPIYNARKQRPASSISEVLEEMERRQIPNTQNTPDGEVGKLGREDEGMELRPLSGRPNLPVTFDDPNDFTSPLLPPIPDELDESHLSSFSGQPSSFGDNSFQKTDTLGSSSSPQGSQMTNGVDGNGDSGYEAESRPEMTEEDISPETLNGFDTSDDAHKLFSFHVPETNSDSSLNLSGISSREHILAEGTSV